MSSKREEERNEKIIRGLMKLPPNRRCINCNSLGPQYVCTNFWTFVCMACSGIHREFTHRVKSVSMAKFTSQEVEALQKGGNQRARETFLKDWDPLKLRLPDSSNADKVREFIRNVYVDRRYAGGKTSDKPPRDTQNLRHNEVETRRASSYHSYSQSPPYDYQYEERRYGKPAPALTRKPGSDRGLYGGKFSSFFSPSRFSDQVHEDRFANEGSNSRASDYSVSSTGDPFRSDPQSPNFQRDIGFNSPPCQTSRDILNFPLQPQTDTLSDSNTKTDVDRIHRPQRTASSGSFGSFDSNSISLKSVNSVSLLDVTSEPEQCSGTHQDKQDAVPSLPQSSVSGNFGGLDLFNASSMPQTVNPASVAESFQLPETSSTPQIDLFQQTNSTPTMSIPPIDLFQQTTSTPTISTPPIDLFQQTTSTPPIDLFQPLSNSSVSALHAHQPSQTIPSSLDLFTEMPQQQPTATFDKKSPDEVFTKNEGWATFDLPQHIPPKLHVDSTPAAVPPTDGSSLGKFDPFSFSTTSLHWPAFENRCVHGPPSMSILWHQGMSNLQVSNNATNTQLWNAFEEPTGHLSLGSIQQSSEEVPVRAPSTTVNQYLGDFNKDGIQGAAPDREPPTPGVPFKLNGSSYAPSSFPSVAGEETHGTDCKSTNPFDVPYDSDFESSSMFLDMSSLQAALPGGQIPNSFLDGATQPWFPQDPVTPYIPAAQQGALGFMGGQVPSTQMPNVSARGPLASVGGNPFA